MMYSYDVWSLGHGVWRWAIWVPGQRWTILIQGDAPTEKEASEAAQREITDLNANPDRAQSLAFVAIFKSVF